ncbi:MAG TPA: hypothetical protein VND70_05465 [Acidimicrobiales bacterium]|nr:hypothetical protein [Acidimicrobiales bacterium]
MARRNRWILLLIVLTVSLVGGGGNAWATTWNAGLAAGSSAEAQAGGLPASAPGSPTSACTGIGPTVNVTWSAVTLPPHGNPALSYSIFESTTSSSSGYSVVATGVIGSTWTSGSLTAGSYWFEIAAAFGTNWLGSNSAATAQRTITLGLLCT